MRNSKPPKRPAGMTPEMERRLRAEASKFGKNQAIKPVDMVPMKGLAALGRQAIVSGIRGAVRPVNSREIADMARRYAEKDKSVLQDIGKLTKRQQQMIRDEIARQYRKVTPMDKAKSLVRKIDKKLDPANTGRTGAIGIGIEEQTPTTQLDEVTIMKSKKYSAGGKLGMMYQNGGAMGGKKKQTPPKKITDVLDRNGRVISPERRRLEAAAAPMLEKYANRAFDANAKAREMENLTEMRNQLKKSDPDALAAFDRSLKAKGMMVAKRPVKKMANGGKVTPSSFIKANKYTDISKFDLPHSERVAWEEASKKKQVKETDLRSGKETGNTIMLKTYIKPKAFAQGGKLKKPGAPNPLNPTKDKNSYISNDVDMSSATKKQMDALRQAMMYFTGVSPKNK